MRYVFQSEQWLPFEPERVFAFFANPRNLPLLMPKWHKAKIEKSALVSPPPSPGLDTPQSTAGTGSRITLSFLPFPLSPIRLSWEAEIEDFVWNSSFADVQLRGPFHYWKHRHAIRPEARDGLSGTLLMDEVHYSPPLSWLGEIANSVFIAKQLQKTFGYRHSRALDLLGETKTTQNNLKRLPS